MPRA
ncbi:hypothetical protein IEO21_10697 [Rhodonia placenta]|jgi:hypothetical protein